MRLKNLSRVLKIGINRLKSKAGVLMVCTSQRKERHWRISFSTHAILYRGIPRLYRWTTVPTLSISYTLAHEVGHHLIATRGYVFQPHEKFKDDANREDFCNRYAFHVTQKMMAHWYYRLGQWALKDLASWYYIFGCRDWNEKKYKKAAERFYTSFHLDRNREDALNWYWRAKD